MEKKILDQIVEKTHRHAPQPTNFSQPCSRLDATSQSGQENGYRCFSSPSAQKSDKKFFFYRPLLYICT